MSTAAGVRRRRGVIAIAALLLVAVGFGLADGPAPSPDDWLAAEGLEPAYFEADGVRLRYVRAGDAASPRRLVLVHGLAASIYTWREVLPALAVDRDVAALDMPGFGGSDLPADLSWPQLPAAVMALLDHLGWERADLVGHSIGGAVATVVAAQAPTRVERLVLVDPAGFALAPEARPRLLRLVGLTLLAPLADRWPWRRQTVALALRQVFHDDATVTPERVNAYWAPTARPGFVASLRALLNESHEIGFGTIARRVVAPTLVVWGRQDAWVPLAHGERFVATIPGSRLEVIDGCGHMPQEETPEQFLRLAIPFLDEASPPPTSG